MAGYSDLSPRYAVVCGPTASGKSSAALALALKTGGEIICADSMQIYRGLVVGTAAPTERDRAAAPHRLYGYVEPQESYSVARDVFDARAAVSGCAASGRLPIVCGGTGLYIDALRDGLSFVGSPPDPALRERLRAEYEENGIAPFMAELAAADPEFAALVDERNVKRVLRSVELLRSSGVTALGQNALSRSGGPFGRALVFVLAPGSREELYARSEARVDAMLARGLLAEARYVYDNRARFLTAEQAIGYKEFFAYFEGRASLEECVGALKLATRHYAKRQTTWFKRERDAVFIDTGGKSPGELAEMIAKECRESL